MAAGGVGPLFDLTGRTALVTGGGSGLGRAVVEALVAAGAYVVVADVSGDRLAKLAAELGSDSVETAVLDVRDTAAVDALVDDVVARRDALDVVFANAGIGRGAGPGVPEGSLDTFDLDDWETLVDVNLYGVLRTVRAAARHMKPRRRGSIVLTASTAGLRADPLVPYSYVVAKAGVVNLTRQAALDLARWGVRVNAIAPGPFQTNIGGEGPADPAVVARWSSMVPLGRMGDPAEIQGLALLLASDAGSFMTGGVHTVDGGAMLQAPALREAGPEAV
ncbi:SDR family NAD(P)-dependent oxidoreductase [Nocardioides sp. DS6]|uniref:SDR family NAD(P)-dependent oxidoreductase n=1 Tax=Nocardioides eburneus TaxID=3231482 RepID=A0ABV3SXI5_9ACTN